MARFRGRSKIKREGLTFVSLSILGFFSFAAISQGPVPTAQAKKKPPQNLLQHEVTVTLKLVQAYVVDPEGNPARDLGAADFVLYDNGKLQVITEFERHFLAVPGVKHEAAEPVAKEDEISVMNRKFIFLLDYMNNDLEGIAKSRKAILQFMDDKAQPADEVALFSFRSPWGLVIHENLTSDHQRIRTALKKIAGIPEISEGWGSYLVFGHSGENILTDMVAVPIGPMIRGASVGRGLVFCLRDLAQALRRVPGQKNIILFSRGIGGDIRDPEFEEMCRDLATANCPVFSVNTVTGIEKVRILPEDSLENVSSLTGGRYFPDVNYEAEIADDIQTATTNYYVLGYSIASDWDGRFHEIKVEVKRPGCKVYAQKGYFNPLPFSKLSAGERQMHLLDLALGEKANPDRRLDFPLTVLPFSPNAEFNAVLIAEIPVRKIREVIGDDTELISLVFDQNRTIADSKRETLNWETNNRQKTYHYSVVSLTPGTYDCRVVLRNLQTGAGALASVAASVPERKEKGLQLFPPLLLRPEKGTLYLKAFQPEKAPGGLGAFSIPDVFSFDPDEYTPLLEKELTTGSDVWASVRCACVGLSPGGVRLAAYLLDEMAGDKIALPLMILSEKEKGNVKTFFVRFRVPELEPGEYAFCLVAEDPASGEMSILGCDFVIQ
jgi:VWFA-related protein